MTKRSNTRPQAEQPADALSAQRERAARQRDAAGRFSRPAVEATPEAQPVPPEAAAEPEAPAAQPPVVLGHVPRPANAHPGTYALRIVDDGLGLHAPAGSSILVEPVTPTGAGLAVFHSKHAECPGVFDLTHDFQPEYAQPFAPGSEVMPVVEVIDPETGKPGRIRADKFDTIHRVIGIYTPADVGLDHRRAPAPLPVVRTCPEGMGTHRVEGAAAYPLVRPGETVVYDGMRREPTDGALCVLQWNSGRRDLLLTNRRPVGNSGPDTWCVDPVNRPPSRAAMERRIQAGTVGTVYASDGPYTAEHLREKIVGTVVGILVPGREPTPQDEPAIEAFTTALEISGQQATDAATPTAEPAEAASGPFSASLDDAELLRLGKEIDRAQARWRAAAQRNREPQERLEAFLDAAEKKPSGATVEDHRAAWDLPGVREANNAQGEAYNRIWGPGNRAWKIPATTPAGVAVKARLLLATYFSDGDYEDRAAEGDGEDVEPRAIRDLIEACCALAGVDWRGDPVAPPMPDKVSSASSDGPDPVLAAIQAHAAARADLDAASNAADEPWRKERGLDVSAEALALAERARDEACAREVETWNAVFATRPETAAGLAAVARHAQQWEPENTGLTGGIAVDGIFGTIAADIERLTSADAGEPATVESVAPLSFEAYAFDDPVGSPAEWADRFAPHSMGLCVADKTLRMTKPELVAFIRDAAGRGKGVDEAMFNAINAAQDTLEGWGKLLGVAAARYLVAASAMTVENDARHADQGGEG